LSDLKTDQDKALYTFGYGQGEGIANFKLSEDEILAFTLGFKDAAKGDSYPLEDRYKYQVEFQQLIQNRLDEISKGALKESEAYMAEFIKEEGSKITDSGLGYKIVAVGNDKRPKDSDVIEIHYTGTLMDGTVFDSSVERGTPAIMKLSNLILGWREGLKFIGEGGKIKLVIPSDLAYGNNGSPRAGIVGGATIIFDIELIRIVEEEKAADPKASGAKKK
jgi:FKBP-type peptidyl-prolyl cis-trans isomerase FkpA